MIFISHRETDTALAKAFVAFLCASLEVPSDKIRCTSVPGFQLPFGKTISVQLKDDISSSNAVFVLITRASLQSLWVIFELGAAWALGKVVVPVLGPGLSLNELPGPLAEYPVVMSDDANAPCRLRDAVYQISRELQIRERGGGGAQSQLESFLKSLRECEATNPPGIKKAMAFELSWLLFCLMGKLARHPTAVEAQIESYASDLGLQLPSTWRQNLVTDDDGGTGFNDLLGHLGGQLVSRRPDLLPYFEAGFNIPFSVSRKDTAVMQSSIGALNLPEEIRDPRGEAIEWANRVNEHFESVLRRRVVNS